MLSAFFLAPLLMLAQPAEDIGTPIPPLNEIKERIAKRDAELFWYAFEGCNAEELRTRLTDDFRMLHDLGGVVAESGDAFAAIVAEQCADRAPGGQYEGYRNRRLLTPGSDQITWLGRWGVLHRGYHTFYEWRSGEEGGEAGWELVGGAHFINVWKWNADREVFEMQETISVDHGSAKPFRPETAE